LRLPGFIDNQHMKVTRLSALRNGRLPPPPGINPWFSFHLEAKSAPAPERGVVSAACDVKHLHWDSVTTLKLL
jgi:hypothetical protein